MEKGVLFLGNKKPLSKLQKGARGKVVQLTEAKGLRSRLLEMGIVPGAEVVMNGVAPFGDPVEVMVKGYHLTLRKSEAEAVFVEVD